MRSIETSNFCEPESSVPKLDEFVIGVSKFELIIESQLVKEVQFNIVENKANHRCPHSKSGDPSEAAAAALARSRGRFLGDSHRAELLKCRSRRCSRNYCFQFARGSVAIGGEEISIAYAKVGTQNTSTNMIVSTKLAKTTPHLTARRTSLINISNSRTSSHFNWHLT